MVPNISKFLLNLRNFAKPGHTASRYEPRYTTQRFNASVEGSVINVMKLFLRNSGKSRFSPMLKQQE